MTDLPSIHDVPCPQMETEDMLNEVRLTLTTLSADPHNNTIGAHLRRLWDAARASGQGHGIWRPQLGRYVTMDELKEMEEASEQNTKQLSQ